jgi:hypothetical protein
MSEALKVQNDFLHPDMRKECESIIPDPQNVDPKDCSEMFIKLKQKFPEIN